MGIKVTIDRDGCISCAACWTVCPEVFEENQTDGLSQIVEQYRVSGDNSKGVASNELDEKIRDAEDRCPPQVIHIG